MTKKNKKGKRDKKDKKVTSEAEQTKIEELLKRIRKISGRGNYIFRGENKNYGKITSTLSRYFNTIVGRAKLQQREIPPAHEFDFNPIEVILKKQLGEEDARQINFADLGDLLKENILDQLAQQHNYRIDVKSAQTNLVLQEVREYVDFENEIDTLVELQHYDGATNLIDFSHDIAVALFFACDGEPRENGRLIMYKEDAEDVISPKKNQNNRAVFQKSVFVLREGGYIDENEKHVKQIVIPKSLKPLLLAYVQNYFNIRTETVYGDLQGFIKNQEKHSEAYKQLTAGVMSLLERKYEESIKCYTEAIKLKPNFALAYSYRGIVYVEMKKLKEAEDDCQEAIKINPNHVGAYNNLGYIFSSKGRNDDAIAFLNKAIEINPRHPQSYNNLGAAYYNKGDYGRAVANYNKAIGFSPNHIEAYNNRGNAYSKMGDYHKAHADYEKAIEIDSSFPDSYLGFGIVKSHLGDPQGAMEVLKVGLQLSRQKGHEDVANIIQKSIDDLNASDSSLPSPPTDSK